MYKFFIQERNKELKLPTTNICYFDEKYIDTISVYNSIKIKIASNDYDQAAHMQINEYNCDQIYA